MTARSMTGSPFTTTSGGGTPTGSGVRGRSARRTRASAGSGRGVTGAAASTGSSSATTSGLTLSTASKSATAVRPASASSKTSSCRSNAPSSSWTGLDNVPSSRSGCAPSVDEDGDCAHPLRPHQTYVNVGFWSSVPVGPGWPSEEGHTNKLIERAVRALDGHKSLYSDAFYSPDEFDELYGVRHTRR